MSTAEKLIETATEKLNEGLVPAKLFNDQEIFELEKERIFNKSWVFLGHESEIPSKGDYVVRRTVDESFILVRDTEGEVKVLSNTCRHQGMELCRTDQGNSSHFRCPYHGWTYKSDGELVGVPSKDFAFEDLDREQWGLMEAPNFDTYNGLIFVNLDSDAESLESHLGDFAWYLDFYTGRDPDGMEVRGPMRQVYNFNWKTIIPNVSGDIYHAPSTHYSAIQAMDESGSKDESGYVEEGSNAGNAFKQAIAGPAAFAIRPANIFDDAPDSVQALHADALTPEHLEFAADVGTPGPGVMFPNMTLNQGVNTADLNVNTAHTFMRKVRPLGPDKTEIMFWAIYESGAPSDYKEESYETSVFTFGNRGIILQDDEVQFKQITKASEGELAADRDINYQMGMETEPLSDWEHRGEVYPNAFVDTNAHHMFSQYLDLLNEGDTDE